MRVGYTAKKVANMVSKSHRDKIFGTPPEPIFNEKTYCLPKDLLDDAFSILVQENKDIMKDASPKEKMGFFKNAKSAEYVFMVCNKFKLHPETKFLAVEIFDRFMVQHIKDLYECVKKSSSRTKKKDWKSIQDRIKNQITLRIVSCCQIASKLASHYRVITTRKAKSFLANAGHRYNEESILQSELRVMKTLDFVVNLRSPVTYIEMLLEIMGKTNHDFEVKIIHGISLKIVDLFYMKRSQIFLQLFVAATGTPTMSSSDREKFMAVECDLMLLAVSVIAASSYIVDQQENDKIVEQLLKITHIPQDDILDFAAILIQEIADVSS